MMAMEAMEADDFFDEQANAHLHRSNRPKLQRHHSEGECYGTVYPDNFFRPRSRSLYSSSRPVVYVTRRVPQRGLDILMEHCNFSQWDSEDPVPRGELLHSVQGVHGLLCMPSDVIDGLVLDAAGPQLRAIATLSETTNHIDVEECARRNIRIHSCTAHDHDLESQADLTIALILLTLRSVAAGRRQDSNHSHSSSCDLFSYQTGKNRRVDVPAAMWNNIVKNKTFGIFGKTALGLAVASRLRQLGTNQLIIGDFQKDCEIGGEEAEAEPGVAGGTGNLNTGDFEVVSKKQFLNRADIVCVCDARASTQKEAVFDREVFELLKPGVILVNSDNSHALNYFALYEALRDQQILAAGLNNCNQQQVPYQHLLQGLQNCVFMAQTQEDRSDLRHKITMTVTTDLLRTLKE